MLNPLGTLTREISLSCGGRKDRVSSNCLSLTAGSTHEHTGHPIASLASVSSAKIRIFVIANQAIYVDGLMRVISDHDSHEVIACAQPGDNSCFSKFSGTTADVLLVEQVAVEAQLQDRTSNSLFGKFLAHNPGLRIIIFGHDISEPFVRKMVRAGVRGFIDTNSTREILITAIDEVYNGGYWVGRNALQQMVMNAVEMEPIIEPGIRSKIETVQDTLTRREVDVLRCVLEGMSTRDISSSLSISEQSVKLYLGRMFKKFDVNNRSQLILMAFQRVCPATNIIQLFRRSLDKRRLQKGQEPLIKDPLIDIL